MTEENIEVECRICRKVFYEGPEDIEDICHVCDTKIQNEIDELNYVKRGKYENKTT